MSEVPVHVIGDKLKRHHSVQVTIMGFAYSRQPLQQVVRDRFHGEWKFPHRALFEIPFGTRSRFLG
jgi:hypothetical protein